MVSGCALTWNDAGFFDARIEFGEEEEYWTVSNIEVHQTKEKGLVFQLGPSYSVAPRPGLEPGTCGLTVRRSTD